MLKIGILSLAHMHGASYIAQIRANPNAQLVGIWDENAERREQWAKASGCAAYSDKNALLDACDAVVICAENIHHLPLTLDAARAKKAILCEKPLATTPTDALQMVQVCKSEGVPLMTAFPCRFSPAFGNLLQAVQNGELGEILGVRGTNRGRCPGGWFVDKTLSGGGAVMDHTVHVADLLRVLTGAEVKTVYCEADNRILHGDFDDTGFLSFTFENGVFATLDASWSRPKVFPTWGDVTLGVTGTKGVMELDMFAQESVLYDDLRGRITYEGWGTSTDKGLVDAFVHAVLSGAPVPITGVDGMRAVEIVTAAYESVRTHQVAPVVRAVV